MKQVNLYEAKSQLSRLVDAASRGESIVIAKSGTPVARLAPLEGGKPAEIRFGLMKGRIDVAVDFDAPLPAGIIEDFEGNGSS